MSHTEVETDFLYMYGVILAEELEKSEVPSIIGIDQNPAIVKIFKNLAAIITSGQCPKFFPTTNRPSFKGYRMVKGKSISSPPMYFEPSIRISQFFPCHFVLFFKMKIIWRVYLTISMMYSYRSLQP